MRVITGTARGRKLATVEGMEVRPTAEKVKEAIFSSVHFELEGAKMADIFCGSGQMGIEALSRGASLCVFVDNGSRSIQVTKQNLIDTKLFQKARVVQTDAKAFLSGTKEKFDIAFLDPPYSQGILQEVLPLLTKVMKDTGIILCEHEEIDILPDEINGFVRVKKYRYSRISVSAYRKTPQTEGKE